MPWIPWEDKVGPGCLTAKGIWILSGKSSKHNAKVPGPLIGYFGLLYELTIFLRHLILNILFNASMFFFSTTLG